MSLSVSDLSELVELWAELNLTADHDNLSHVETVVCSGAAGHAAFLHVLSVFYVLVFAAGVAANVLVLWVNLRSERRRRQAHLYVVHLAAADLCVVATLPVWAASLLRGGRWPFGDAVCRLTHLSFSVSLFASIFFLACLSADRCLLAARPPGGRGARRRLVCVAVWLLALAASVPDAYFVRAVASAAQDGAVCRPVYPPANPRAWTASVQLSFSVLGFVVPLPVIAVSSLRLAAAAPPGAAPLGAAPAGSERRLVLACVAAFVACWLPLHAVLLMDSLALLGVLPFSCRRENFVDAALHVTQSFSLLHCCINPVLYGFLRRGHRLRLVKAFFFRYSTKTGLARLIDGSHASDSEHSAGTLDGAAAM